MHRLSRLTFMAAAAGIALSAFCAMPASAYDNTYFDPVTRQWLEMKLTPEVAAKIARREYKRKTVTYNGPEAPGTIIVDTTERRLYHVLENGKAMRYGIGVGRDGFTWKGEEKVTRKAEWPGWTPPPEMIARERKKRPQASRLHGWRPGESAGCPRTLSRQHHLPHPWHQRGLEHRPGRLLRLFSHVE
ncbi:L,D-transpeptidase [Pannonibacter sp. Pt2-lr]